MKNRLRSPRYFVAIGSVIQAPNAALRELADVMGDDATREIVWLFLNDFPYSMRRLHLGNREEQLRVAHGLKSSALHMGARVLSERMALVEDRINRGNTGLAPAELKAALADFEAIAPELKRYAGPEMPAKIRT